MERLHPYARGQDEVYRFASLFEFNVDQARRLIADGTIGCDPSPLPVFEWGRRFLALPEQMFGAARQADGSMCYDAAAEVMHSMSARTYVNVGRLASIPLEAMARPGMTIVWNLRQAALAAARARGGQTDGAPDRSYSMLVDGNHRLARAFLEGQEEPLACQALTQWADVERCLLCLGKPVLQPSSRRRNRTAPNTPLFPRRAGL